MADNQLGAGEGLVLVPAGLTDDAFADVTRPFVIGGEARLAVGAPEAERLVALVAARTSRHDHRRQELNADISQAERGVRDCEALAGEAAAARTAADARVQGLTSALAALQAALGRADEVERAWHDAQASADACEDRLLSAAAHRTTLDRVVQEVEGRVRGHLAGSSDSEWLPLGDDVRERGAQLAADAEQARACAAQARVVVGMAERDATAAAAAHRKAWEAAADCRARLVAAPVPDDVAVRAALVAYTSAATMNGTDPEAGRVADRLAALACRAAELAALGLPPPPPEVLEAARQRVRDATTRVEEAERAANETRLTAAQWAELDEAHQAASTQEGRPRPHVPGRVPKRASDAQLHFDALLSAHGFAGVLDYRLRSGERDRDLTSALDDARRLLEVAHAELGALEEAAAPSREEAELQRALTDAQREGAALLGYDPGQRLEEFLRSKPDVPATLTRELVEALDAAGAAPVGLPLQATASAWLAHCDAQRRARSAIEAELAVLDAQVEALESLGPAAPGTQLLVGAAQSVAAFADERARHAARLVDLLAEELDASHAAAQEDEADARRAASASEALAALHALAADAEGHQQRVRDDARQALARAKAAHEEAQAALADAETRVASQLGTAAQHGALLEAALAELDRALKDASAAHASFTSASARRDGAVATLASKRNELAGLDAAPPPPMRERPSPFEIVAALRWIVGCPSNDTPVVLMAGFGQGPSDGSLQPTRDHWVIVPSDLVTALDAHDAQHVSDAEVHDLPGSRPQVVTRRRRLIRRG